MPDIRIDPERAAQAVRDEEMLRRLGYPQLLARSLGGFRSMGVAFSIICVLGGASIMFSTGMIYGGPAEIVWGWIGVSLLTLTVGAAMGEVCSPYPTSGGLYFQAARLATRNHAAWAWFTGWFNLLGQIAGTAGACFGVAYFVLAFGNLQWGWTATPGHVVIAYLVVIAAIGAAVTYGRRLVGWIGAVAVWWHVLGLVLVVAVLVALPSHHQTTAFVFTYFVTGGGFHNEFYVGLLGLLVGAETYTGYDACAHMSEETHNAAVAAPRSIVRAIALAGGLGTVYLIMLTYSITNYSGELNSPTGEPVAQIFVDSLGVTTAKLLVLMLVMALLYCVSGNLTSNSRMIYAFSRDFAREDDHHGHSVSRRLSQVDPGSRTPRYAVWAAVASAALLGLLNMWSSVAFDAAISINVIGLYTAYAIPVFLRLRQGRHFQRGTWHLGRFSTPVCWIAVSWVAVCDVIFVLPTVTPITPATFNYTLPVFATVVGGAAVWWRVSAHRWFRGPRRMETTQHLVGEMP